MDNYGYDGIDLDWEHPSNSTETNNLTLLVQELRDAFNSVNPEFMITMAVGASNWSGQHYEYEIIKENLDWFSLMGYDFHGSWSSHAGHNAPLYQSPPGDPDGSVHTGVNYLVNTRNIPVEKLNLGVPFYGKKFNASAINGSYIGTVADIWYDEAADMDNGHPHPNNIPALWQPYLQLRHTKYPPQYRCNCHLLHWH
jgi:chitinase